MELGTADKLRMIEETLQRLTNAVMFLQEGVNSNLAPRLNPSCLARDETAIDDIWRAPFFHKSPKLDFHTFAGGDPTE